ncbi:unnamed protein product [Tilletia controversa]|uniref:Glycoside hydrolase family 3 N-terminal domain-containing protein n=1 Tax=Tilletia controversa TaxID=13291 RepID=A0A8X7MY50_9BASI|nr:hypothetical protein CF328_g6972 [Tilletia controversa]KAE8252544.1 hypothetical protein A4X06_0g2115 [Tilletia controversa]CAD6932006.1 unnamed protein product [Tilletia controversa]CAD6979753.1 unnamed protein product [Tilletia controversa]
MRGFNTLNALLTLALVTTSSVNAVTPWSASEQSAAEAAVSKMSVRQKAGRVLMTRVSDQASGAVLIAQINLGGVILFANNVQSKSQVASLNANFTATYDNLNLPGGAPLLISVDQEGAIVARVQEAAGATDFPTLMTHGSANQTTLTTQAFSAAAQELLSMGFNMVAAPDADVTIGPTDPTIGSRSAGSSPAQVGMIVNAALAGQKQIGILGQIKHFPGHGAVNTSSEVTLPVQYESLEQMKARDLIPFQQAIVAGVPSIMVAHLLIPALDTSNPSSLSPAAINLIRNEYGFEGVLSTDSLGMGAITSQYGNDQSGATAAVAALNAGQDLLLMPPDPVKAHTAIVQAVYGGNLPIARLDEAATRVIALALYSARMRTNKYGSAGGKPALSVMSSQAHKDASYAASLAGLVVTNGACSGSLLNGARSVQVVGSSSASRSRLTAAAQAAGLSVTSGANIVIGLAGYGAASFPSGTTIAVALDTPYVLNTTSADTRIALFGQTPQAFEALVDILTGQAQGGGRLPVTVTGLQRASCK